ncbi:hypothetical protein Tco_0772035 [Tanacetum coccineum]|uniref:Integrase, catalytic region, zinc finger, CCHC-type, peptidase aspartic, catalytic n=1 Tax=Tanacetum coccineum TaxID=301880 RepID=A0ABQ4ZGR8_9ASTR
MSDEQALHPITDQSASSPVKIEAPQELPKASLVNTSLKNLKYHLGQFNNVVKKHIMANALIEGEWGFEHTKVVFQNEIIPFLKNLKDIFNVFDKDLLNKKQFLIENDRLLDQIISQDIMNIVVNSSVDVNTCVKVNSSVVINDSVNYVEMCNKCLELEAELIKQHNMVEKDEYNRLSKRFSKLEQHCISLEIAMQLNKEIFQKNKTSVNQTEPSFDQLFELNNLKAELQAKDTTIEKLKTNIKHLNKTSTTNNVKKDIDEIETINIELEHRKLDPVILAPKVKNNREAHEYYLKHTMEKAAILRELIQELLGYVRDTCLDIYRPSEKLVVVTPINKRKKVQFADTKSNSKDVCNEHVKHPVKGAHALCSVCNECLFNANHAICLIDHVNSMNVCAKSVSKKNKMRKEWKPIRKVFNSVGYKWKPTGRTFTLVRNACLLTRITATNKVPIRVPIPLEVVAPKQVVTRVYTRRPKVPKSIQNSKPKVVKSMTANRMEPGTSRGFDTSVASSSSSLIDYRLSKLFCGIWTLDALST